MRQTANIGCLRRSLVLSQRVGFALILWVSTVAHAEQGYYQKSYLDQIGTKGSVTLMSDYVFRGVSLTRSDPAVGGKIHFEHDSGVFARAFASNVSMGSTHFRAIPELGYHYIFDSAMEFGLSTQYFAHWRRSALNTFGFEVSALLLQSIGLSYFLSPDWLGTGGLAGYLALNWNLVLPYFIGFYLHAGFSHFDSDVGLKNYGDFRMGVSYTLLELKWALEGTIVTKKQFAGHAEPRVIVSLSKSLQ